MYLEASSSSAAASAAGQRLGTGCMCACM